MADTSIFTAPCPICLGQAESQPTTTRATSYICPRCGTFTITSEAWYACKDLKENERYLLCCWLRQESDNGVHVRATTDVLHDQMSRLADRTILQKLDLALSLVARRTRFGGDYVGFSPVDAPAAWAVNHSELVYLLDTLSKDDLVDFMRLNGDLVSCCITAKGWARLGESAQSGLNSTLAFVAMAFAEELKPAFESGIAPAVRDAGYRAHRVDSVPHVERIDWKIIQDIKASRFVVADVTMHKNGVYFEAGYAIGIGRKVIWTVQKDHLKDAHFDTRQFVHIIWNDADDLRDQLHRTIIGVIGKGPGVSD